MINRLLERALSIVLSDLEALYHTSYHHRNIEKLMSEFYKIKNEITPRLMDSMLNRKNAINNF